MRRFLVLLAFVLTVAGCSGEAVDFSAVPELPTVTTAELTAQLAASSRPTVVNVWASWCVPCRSEAPLLAAASEAFAGDIIFIGLNVRDSQDDARAFIAEFDFGADKGWEHLFDSSGTVPVDLGGNRGVPLTFFVAADGQIVTIHRGVIDERTLALGIDELLRR
ncbi:MAG: redoxin family protein [Acidimicrobiia bacterium]|nr:redoxin family protein [Acidimicrobiia bacterium]